MSRFTLYYLPLAVLGWLAKHHSKNSWARLNTKLANFQPIFCQNRSVGSYTISYMNYLRTWCFQFLAGWLTEVGCWMFLFLTHVLGLILFLSLIFLTSLFLFQSKNMILWWPIYGYHQVGGDIEQLLVFFLNKIVIDYHHLAPILQYPLFSNYKNNCFIVHVFQSAK